MAKLLYVVENADLRCRHTGLWIQARKLGAKPEKMKKGDVVAFLNSEKSMIATLAITGEADSKGVLSFYVSPHGRVEPHAIRYIPECMGASGDLNMTAATRKALDELIPAKRRQNLRQEGADK